MGSKWRKVKLALGLNLCVYSPRTLEDSQLNSTDGLSNATLLSPGDWNMASSRSMTPAASSLGLTLSRSSSSCKSSKTCPICLTKMKEGGGQAIFTAECAHSFHYHCITSNVRHGNQICPVCRAKWKEIPMQQRSRPSLDHPPGRPLIRPVVLPHNNEMITLVRRTPVPRQNHNSRSVSSPNTPEPSVFNDDECLDHLQHVADEKGSRNNNVADRGSISSMEIKVYPEVSAVPHKKSCNEFSVLIHLKAASNFTRDNMTANHVNPRTPADLVTVLDISGSMAGTKLALLKRAMGFVIQNLGSSDRLSVISFSSTARRLFPLRRMSDTGKQQALQAVNSLVANGGTNIAEGLRKGTKLMEDRRHKNPVSSIILLSDGQDTYNACNSGGSIRTQINYSILLPLSSGGMRFHIPVHTFGFGADHDAAAMHSISELSGGTFSFIESEAVIQDALAQCIGGLLSVSVQELQVGMESVHPSVHISSVKAGSYTSRLMDNSYSGFIDVGDLYADEERDFLVSVNIPRADSSSGNETPLLKVRCIFKDPITKKDKTLESDVVTVQRPESVAEEVVSVEVDRQRNRFKAAEAMTQARSLAEQGDLAAAISVLENFRRILSESMSAKSNDRLCMALDAELKEMQERMASRHMYESSGRAYVLSGLSSHSWQRATARGDSIDGSSLVQSYQTPLMAEMLTRSQATMSESLPDQRLFQPLLYSPRG